MFKKILYPTDFSDVAHKALEYMKRLKQAGISCGMYLLPVIPFITDTPKMMEEALKKGKEAGIDFIIFGTMTLKEGMQKQYYMDMLKKQYPKLAAHYGIIYSKNSQWGEASVRYNTSVHQLFNQLASGCNIPKRIPPNIYQSLVNKQDLIIVILEHLDYLLKLNNKTSPYGYAAYSLSKLKVPIENLTSEELMKTKGVGPVIVKIIREIINTGTCSLYEELL